MSLRLPHQLMVHRDLLHDLGSVYLSLQDILLHSLANLIMSGGILNQLVKHGLVLPKDAKRLLEIGQLKIVSLERIGDASFCYFYFSLFRVGVAFGNVSPQPYFPWI